MKKEAAVLLFLIGLLSFSFTSATSVNDEIRVLTNYAEDYETGNINYAQLVVYLSSVRERLNELMGSFSSKEGGLLKQEQIKDALGEPQKTTKWIWIEGENREKRLDEELPVWEKIVFDGKKIQIRFNAYPSIIKKEKLIENTKGEEVVYRLHFDTQFKRPQEQLDIEPKIDEIKFLAEQFNADSSDESAERLAKESVNAERIFEQYFRQRQGRCEDVMENIFGIENKKPTQKMLVNEINFMSGENFDAVMRIEMCDECEWSWINLNMWIERRGPGFKQEENKFEESSKEKYKQMNSEEFKSEIKKTIEEMKTLIQKGEYGKAQELNGQLQMINEAWTEKSNDVWKDLDKEFNSKRESMTEEERKQFDQSYGWIKEEQEKRTKAKELQQKNYLERKQFYLDLFSEYEKKEFYFQQTEFEKRLVENFIGEGDEICNNNYDDNNDGNIDCMDARCNGQFCGMQEIQITNENGTELINQELFCIANTCQAKLEINESVSGPVCGNNICEENENVCDYSPNNETSKLNNTQCGPNYCPEDCTSCIEHPPIECFGKVIFSGEDKKGCPLEPICISETVNFCNTSEECTQPLCGVVECIKESSEKEGICKTVDLKECEETKCVNGEEKLQLCDSGEKIISEICIDGLWKSTERKCEKIIEEINKSEEKTGNECVVKEDCGRNNDVCSNGICVTLPETIAKQSEEEISDSQLSEETMKEDEKEEESSSENLLDKTVIQIFAVLGKATGMVTGFVTEETEESTNGGENLENSNEENLPPKENKNSIEEDFSKEFEENNEENIEKAEENYEDERNEREDEERQRWERENKERCEIDCSRPCIDKCIRENCGEELECNVDEEKKKCEESCKPELSCIEKCMKGEENWWKEFENKEEREIEKGVFNMGGGCRDTTKEEFGSNGFIWFGGWGDPFERIQPLKHKYYQRGDNDWCKNELENLKKQREEFEESMNEEFVKWFFEDHLANSAEDWEQQVSGIFELYWKDVEISRETAYRMNCLNKKESLDYNLIGKIEYETEYGRLEFWEELKTAKLQGMNEEVSLVSPYMRVWVFPNKEVMKSMMKKSMKDHKFPGPSDEEKNQGGPSEEEKEMIKQDKEFMEKINELSDKYNGDVDAVVQLKDFETNDIAFNLYVKMNPEDIIKIEPMLPEEISFEEIKVELDFNKVYDLIYTSEKDMQGERIETPPWDREKVKPIQKIKEVKNGIQMYFKVRDIINSAKVYPESSERDAKSLIKEMMKKMGEGDENKMNPEDEEKIREMEEKEGDIWEKEEILTGEVIA